MPRPRSGSFYCPLEPALPALSIAQKAAISTAPVPSSSPSTSSSTSSSSSSQQRRHIRTPSIHGNSEPTSVTLPAAKLETTFGPVQPLSIRGGPRQCQSSQRHPWSPSRPSPLRRQTNATVPPSALWTTHTELLPLYQSQSQSVISHKSRPRSHASLCQSVTKNAFLSGPMGEKANMYGLRVAWCVFGDIKETLAKDIFVSGSQAGYAGPTASAASSSSSSDEEPQHVKVVQSDALSPPPTLPRSRLRREQSFVWDVQGPLVTPDIIMIVEPTSHFDHLDSDTDSDSEYSDDGDDDDEDTESAESDDLDLDLSLDDEEEVQRDIMALLSSHDDKQTTMDGNDRWDMMSFLL